MRHEKCLPFGNPLRILVVIALLALGGCAGWDAAPAREEANYGASVRNMVLNQIANQDKAQHPATQAPDGVDGIKAGSVLEQAYRRDIGRPETVRQHSTFGTPTTGTGTGIR